MKYQSIADFPSAVRYVFQETRRTIRYAVADPAGYNYNVGAYLNTGNRREEVKSHLESAYRRARKAQEYAAKGKMEEAYSNWQLIFGTYFPVYD